VRHMVFSWFIKSFGESLRMNASVSSSLTRILAFRAFASLHLVTQRAAWRACTLCLVDLLGAWAWHASFGATQVMVRTFKDDPERCISTLVAVEARGRRPVESIGVRRASKTGNTWKTSRAPRPSETLGFRVSMDPFANHQNEIIALLTVMRTPAMKETGAGENGKGPMGLLRNQFAFTHLPELLCREARKAWKANDTQAGFRATLPLHAKSNKCAESIELVPR